MIDRKWVHIRAHELVTGDAVAMCGQLLYLIHDAARTSVDDGDVMLILNKDRHGTDNQVVAWFPVNMGVRARREVIREQPQ